MNTRFSAKDFNYLKGVSWLLLLLLLWQSHAAVAQRNPVINLPKYDLAPYHFGFILAGNQMFYTLKPIDGHVFTSYAHINDDKEFPTATDTLRLYEVTARPTPGFTIGIVGNLRLGNHFDLRFVPSLAFGERHLDYQIYQDRDTLVQVSKSNASTFVDFPLHIKFRSKRHNNVAAYLISGLKYSLDLASDKKNEDKNNDLPVRMNQHDLAVDVGVGFDFYNNYFKFGVEAKMSYGIFDILVPAGYVYTGGLERVNNKVFQLSFTFE